MEIKGIAITVNETEQKEVLEMLSDFDCNIYSDLYKFPLLIDFENKTIRRLTSITCCAIMFENGDIIKDYKKAKEIIENYLQTQNQVTNSL